MRGNAPRHLQGTMLMRIFRLTACALLSLGLLACSGVEIEPDPVDEFTAAEYRYYRWRTKPLPVDARPADPVYRLDPVMRSEVDAILREKGYELEPDRAEFSVDYLYAPGLREGAEPEQASNISPIPRITANRQVDQASVDNAIALGGLKETRNILLRFNDIASHRVVWQVRMSKIVENANRVDEKALAEDLRKYLSRAMGDLPEAGSRTIK
ncbi:MAG: DUF4136 domain-containing protein [Halioglobus sp.]|nr:DUF4136 domain-containing protein [Halioglobus sp.]